MPRPTFPLIGVVITDCFGQAIWLSLSVVKASTSRLGFLVGRRSVASLLPGRGGTLVPTSRQAVSRSLQTARQGRSGSIPEEEIPPRILDTPH